MSSTPFDVLKLPQRTRLLAAVAHLQSTGRLNRSDICRIGEVSIAQAAIDLRTINRLMPYLMSYDKSVKAYRLANDQR